MRLTLNMTYDLAWKVVLSEARGFLIRMAELLNIVIMRKIGKLMACGFTNFNEIQAYL